MRRHRANTSSISKEAHSVSLKGRSQHNEVNDSRLMVVSSQPSFAQQHPLPRHNTAGVQHEASLAVPSLSTDQDFLLSTNLALPPSFGSAYVGEPFSCSLCANNELTTESSNTKSVSNVQIAAEMQTPSQTTLPLPLYSSRESEDNSTQSQPGDSVQRIIRFDLKEEGNHVLAVNVSYTEAFQSHPQSGPGLTPSNSRVRSFRKLYQFVAQPCLSVRTKASELIPHEIPDKSLGPYGRASLLRYALEAQLENVSESRIVLEQAVFKPVPPFKSTSLNWDSAAGGDKTSIDTVALSPRDVMQIAFLVEQEEGAMTGVEDLKTNLKRDGRTVLGQVSIQWRGIMGEHGSLSTGNLLTRKRQ